MINHTRSIVQIMQTLVTALVAQKSTNYTLKLNSKIMLKMTPAMLPLDSPYHTMKSP